MEERNLLGQLLEAQRYGNDRLVLIEKIFNGDPIDPDKPGILIRMDRLENKLDEFLREREANRSLFKGAIVSGALGIMALVANLVLIVFEHVVRK